MTTLAVYDADDTSSDDPGTLEFALTHANPGDTIQFRTSNTFTLPRDFALPAGTLTFDLAGYNDTIGGGALTDPASGQASVAVIDSVDNGGGSTLTLKHANSYSGATTIGGTSGTGATLQGGVADAFSPNSAVLLYGSDDVYGTVTLDLGGFDQQIGSLADAADSFTSLERVTNSGGQAATLTVGSDNTSTTFGGTISDGDFTLALNKVGTGTLTLNGEGGYSGGTTITAGTLEFATNNALPKSGTAITFAGPGATLALDQAPGAAPPVIVPNEPIILDAMPRVAVSTNTSQFPNPLADFGPGDALDLRNIDFTSSPTATVDGDTLRVISGTKEEDFTLTTPRSIAGIAVTDDKQAATTGDESDGTRVTAYALPTVSGVPAGSTQTTSEQPVKPFAGTAVTDPNGGTDTVTITISGTGGTLAGTGLTKNQDGTYTVAATQGETVSQNLDALTFTPTAGAPGTSSTTTFSLVDQSSVATAATSGVVTTSVVDTDPAAPAPAPSPTPAPAPAPTQPVQPAPAAAAPVDSITVDQNVTYNYDGTFTITGKATSTVGVKGVEFTTEIGGRGGALVDLGAATVNPDGTFSFVDRVDNRLQGFITATETDGQGLQTEADFHPALQGGKDPHMDRYDVTPTAVTYTGTTDYNPDGSTRVSVTAPGQTVASTYHDIFSNGGEPETTFVFNPGFGFDIVKLFRPDNVDHDTLSFKGSDFGNSVANVLAHTYQSPGGTSFIYDPASHDVVKLAGVSKKELTTYAQQDITFHA